MSDQDSESGNNSDRDRTKGILSGKKSTRDEQGTGESEAWGSMVKTNLPIHSGRRIDKSGKKPDSEIEGPSDEHHPVPHSVSSEANNPENHNSGSESMASSSSSDE